MYISDERKLVVNKRINIPTAIYISTYMAIKRFAYRFQSLKLAVSFNRNALLSGSLTKWLTELSVDTLYSNKRI